MVQLVMTLASHARGPEFEPRCEYYQNFCEQILVILRFFFEKKTIFVILTFFFFPQHIYFGKTGVHTEIGNTTQCRRQRFHSVYQVEEALVMIQACIKVNHIIHGKVWNCRIQVFSKLVESACHGFQFLYLGTDAPNLQWVWAKRDVTTKVQYLCSRKYTTVKEKHK